MPADVEDESKNRSQIYNMTIEMSALPGVGQPNIVESYDDRESGEIVDHRHTIAKTKNIKGKKPKNSSKSHKRPQRPP